MSGDPVIVVRPRVVDVDGCVEVAVDVGCGECETPLRSVARYTVPAGGRVLVRLPADVAALVARHRSSGECPAVTPPCRDLAVGDRLDGACETCGHARGLHRIPDRVCAACEVVAEMRRTVTP